MRDQRLNHERKEDLSVSYKKKMKENFLINVPRLLVLRSLCKFLKDMDR